MTRGPKKHLKRLNAPKHWMLDKLTGAFAPKPSCGPHKQRECLPMLLLLRNRLKYALTYREVKLIVLQRLIKVDHQVRSDHLYPIGYQDVVTIDRTGENFRLLLDTKGRFVVHPIDPEEAKFKLCKVKTKKVGDKGIPVITTHDGRTFRYPDHPQRSTRPPPRAAQPVSRAWRRQATRRDGGDRLLVTKPNCSETAS